MKGKIKMNPNAMMKPPKKGTFKRLIKYMFKNYRWQLIVVIICIVLSSIAATSASIFMQKLIDDCIVPGISNGLDAVWKSLLKVLVTMGSIYVIGLIATTIYTQIMSKVTQGLLACFRKDMFSKMETLPINYFDTHAHGDIMSTYTNDTDAIRQLIGQSIPTLIQSSISLIAFFALMLFYSFWLTLVVIIAMFFMINVTKKFGGASSKYMVKQQKALAKEEGFIEEMINGQKVVKVFCHEQENSNNFDKLNEQLFKDSEKANKFGNVLMPILGNIGNILYVTIAIVGAILVYLGVYNIGFQGIFAGSFSTISIGIIITFLTMGRQFSQTVNQMSMQVSMIAMGLAGASRIFELMDEEPEFDEGYVTLVKARKNAVGEIEESDEYTGMWAWRHPHKDDGTVTYQELKGEITLNEVDFGYVEDKLVLQDVSLYAKPGQKIAFVGSTGAGKTTITNLINRFYDIADGKIRYDGININKIKKSDLRKSLGIVLQDVNLFTGTVMDNIRYGKLEATDEECVEAAKLANAHDFIMRLPEGYNTILSGNGSNLSQGQRQLISIARAAVANTPAMILDEATSSIDSRTEVLVQDGMDKLMKGRTVFVIAHRLSTIRNSDAIMVLEKGRIIERGDHDDLIKQKGTYYQLYTGMFELE